MPVNWREELQRVKHREYKRPQKRTNVQKHQGMEAKGALGLKSIIKSWKNMIQGINSKDIDCVELGKHIGHPVLKVCFIRNPHWMAMLRRRSWSADLVGLEAGLEAEAGLKETEVALVGGL
jgi:hypothetical protein